ncbi:MAG: DEAD/DEAH box helicase [Bacteroidales bacterium]|nr:MAG: DEAD/DEAH box helicase [Bacteroidales bacterium]
MQKEHQNTEIFAIALQQHRYLGMIFIPYIIRLINSEGEIYTIVESINELNQKKWDSIIPDGGNELLKIINEISDTTIHKQFSKGKTSASDFYKSFDKNEQVFQFIRAYIERRMIKCFDILCKIKTPVFLKEKNFNNLYEDHRLIPIEEQALPIFHFSVTETESRYRIDASCNGKSINLTTKESEVICNEPCLLRVKNNLYRFSGIEGKKLSPFFTKQHISIPKSAEKKYFETFVLNTIRNQIVEPIGFSIERSNPEKKAILSIEDRLAGGIGLTLKFYYGKKQYFANAKPDPEVILNIENDRYRFNRFERDTEWEKRCAEKLGELGLKKTGESEFMPTEIAGDFNGQPPYPLVEWINKNQDRIESAEFEIQQNNGKEKYYLHNYRVEINSQSSEDWFDLYGKVILSGFELPFIHLKKNILKNIREFLLPNNQIFILPEEWFTRYRPLFFLGKESGEKIAIQKSLFNLLIDCKVDAPSALQLRDKFSSNIPEKIKLPIGLNAQLRNYQKEGYLWLNLLQQNGLGGCLADDMGLGKTIQTLALLLSLKEKREDSVNAPIGSEVKTIGHTSLIVVPTSLVHNWIQELLRFTPQLTYYSHTGPLRNKSVTEIIKYDIVVTTYGVVRNDIDLLKDIRFKYLILDESQAIKNPLSKIYRSVLLLKASNYLTISGTPIENSLSDLWAQLNFLNRGMLGSIKSFNEEFIQPIEKNNDTQKGELLKILIEPFILRRTKEQVAKDLPDITEQIIYCEMSDAQRKCYESEKSSVRNSILENIAALGYNRSAIAIFRGLTRLRQLANHPNMIEDYAGSDSGKFEEITRSIDSIVAEGHKILIFSSFVKHLKIVANYLNESGISHEVLTGATTNRKEVVEHFQSDPTVKVFLISIKAGGVGLNLTAADYIFILDPWWNPAVENQAVSRAHRIGQDKNIFVYRFITLDTVEEKILRLQEKKELLAQTFVDSANPLKILGEGRILEVLE